MQRSSVELRSRGASQGLSLLCLELAQGSGLWFDLQKVFLDTPIITKRRSIIALKLAPEHPNSAAFAIFNYFF